MNYVGRINYSTGMIEYGNWIGTRFYIAYSIPLDYALNEAA